MYMKLAAAFLAALLIAGCGSNSERSAATTGGGATQGGGAKTAPIRAATGQALPGPSEGSQEHLLVNVGDRVFFGYDRSDLSGESQAIVETLATWMKTYPAVTLTIEGHADERGTREYNLALGDRRANSVRDYLIALGVDPNRLTTISYGKERPAVLGSSEDSWAQNRRGVFVVG